MSRAREYATCPSVKFIQAHKKGRRRKSHGGKDAQFRNGRQSGRNPRNDLISSPQQIPSPRAVRAVDSRFLGERESGTISAKLSERSGSLTHLELRGGAQAQFCGSCSFQVSHFRRLSRSVAQKKISMSGRPVFDAPAWRIRWTSFRRNSLSGF
jgi:hypothetical protein